MLALTYYPIDAYPPMFDMETLAISKHNELIYLKGRHIYSQLFCMHLQCQISNSAINIYNMHDYGVIYSHLDIHPLTRPFIYLSIFPSHSFIGSSIHPPLNLFIYPSIHPSIYLSIHPSIYLSIKQLVIYLSKCQSINSSLYPSIHPPMHPSTHSSIHSSFHQTIGSSIYQSTYCHLFIHPSIPLYHS